HSHRWTLRSDRGRIVIVTELTRFSDHAGIGAYLGFSTFDAKTVSITPPSESEQIPLDGGPAAWTRIGESVHRFGQPSINSIGSFSGTHCYMAQIPVTLPVLGVTEVHSEYGLVLSSRSIIGAIVMFVALAVV